MPEGKRRLTMTSLLPLRAASAWPTCCRRPRRRGRLTRLRALMWAALVVPGMALAGMGGARASVVEDAQASHAVVFAYVRVGDDARPELSVTLDQFEEHLQELKAGNYNVARLDDVVVALRDGVPLPDRTVVLTFDLAHRASMQLAVPRLEAAGFPYAVFVPPALVDAGGEQVMSWDELRDLKARGAVIGLQTISVNDLAHTSLDRMQADLDDAIRRYHEEFGSDPQLFAYPFGEYSLALRDLVRSRGLTAAFGRQSSVAYTGDDLFALPRFPLSGNFAGIDRFRLAAEALPLPVSDVTPRDPVLVAENPPNFGFTLPDALSGVEQLACFASGQGRTELNWLGDTRVEIRLNEPFPPGQARINCTMPTDDGRWRWFGRQFFIAGPTDVGMLMAP